MVAYLDPAKPNLHFSTVTYLAERFTFIGFTINLPFSGMHRSMAAGGIDGPSLVLDHPNPLELMSPQERRTAENIRDYYDEQLRSLGLQHISRRQINTSVTNSPLYDVVMASRRAMAVKLFDKANPLAQAYEQTSIFDQLA